MLLSCGDLILIERNKRYKMLKKSDLTSLLQYMYSENPPVSIRTRTCTVRKGHQRREGQCAKQRSFYDRNTGEHKLFY